MMIYYKKDNSKLQAPKLKVLCKDIVCMLATLSLIVLGQVLLYAQNPNATSTTIDIVSNTDTGTITSTTFGSGANKLASVDTSLELKEQNPAVDVMKLYKRFSNGEMGIDGLSGGVNITVSRDGSEVFVAGNKDDAIAIFKYIKSDRSLNYIGVISFSHPSISGLGGVWDIELSSSKKDMYVTAYDKDALHWYKKNKDERWVYMNSYFNNQIAITGLNGPRELMLSPDDKFLYVASEVDNDIAIFSRNTESGEISFLSSVKGDLQGVRGLNGTRGLAMNKEGTKLYATGYASNSLVEFRRDEKTGLLVFVKAFINKENGINGLRGASAVSVSDSGKVFVVGFKDNAISVFSNMPNKVTESAAYVEGGSVLGADIATSGVQDKIKDAGAVSLQFETALFNGADGVRGLLRPNKVVVRAQSEVVYVSSYDADSLTEFQYVEQYAFGVEGSLVKEKIFSQTGFFSNELKDIAGLDGAWGIAVSPDSQVYVSGYKSSALSIFDVTAYQGLLEYKRTFFDNEGQIRGLRGAYDIEVSKDNKFIYVSGVYDNSIAIFDNKMDAQENRSLVVFNSSMQDGVASMNFERDRTKIIKQGLESISGIWNMVLSNDGKNLYATRYSDNALVIFKRDTQTGSLMHIKTLNDNVEDADGLAGAYDVEVSNDDKYVYVSGFRDDSLAIYKRDSFSGLLSLVDIKKDGVDKVNGLDGAYAIEVSDDDRYIYVSGKLDGAISVIKRQGDTFVFDSFIQHDSNNPIAGAGEFAINKQGTALYVLSDQMDALVVYDMTENNRLQISYVIEADGNTPFSAFAQAKDIEISPNGDYLYVSTSAGLAVFALSLSDAPVYLNTYNSLNHGTKNTAQFQGVATSQDGAHIYMAGYEDGSMQVWDQITGE